MKTKIIGAVLTIMVLAGLTACGEPTTVEGRFTQCVDSVVGTAHMYDKDIDMKQIIKACQEEVGK